MSTVIYSILYIDEIAKFGTLLLISGGEVQTAVPINKDNPI